MYLHSVINIQSVGSSVALYMMCIANMIPAALR